MFRFLFLDLVRDRQDLLDGEDPQLLIQQFLRTASEPLFPSKKDLATATDSILKEEPHLRLPSTDREKRARGRFEARGPLRGAADREPEEEEARQEAERRGGEPAAPPAARRPF